MYYSKQLTLQEELSSLLATSISTFYSEIPEFPLNITIIKYFTEENSTVALSVALCDDLYVLCDDSNALCDDRHATTPMRYATIAKRHVAPSKNCLEARDYNKRHLPHDCTTGYSW